MATMTIPQRSSGILLHPTSLPGPYGIGDLGPAAYSWVDALVEARQSWWQVLPLTPTGYADSPYQSLSAFAGNPNLISPDLLIADGLLRPDDLPVLDFPASHVDFEGGRVIALKQHVLARAWAYFQATALPALRADYEAYLDAESAWLEPFGIYMALKDAHHGASWQDWDEPYRLRQPQAIQGVRQQLGDAIAQHQFRQFLFARQWGALRRYANQRGLRLIGDVPIFVSADSADVWGNHSFFQLDARRRPLAVAGVPPDYFSATGQLWGNPLYDWAALHADGYAWWAERMRAVLRQVDVVRIDHFRGFQANWAVPFGQLTAQNGQWMPGPANDLFDALLAQLGEAPIIAEDLGLITPEVDRLRARYGFPGMRILQFAFGGAVERRFLPHNYEPNTVVYTGTHDNDTTLGWYRHCTPAEKAAMARYLGGVGPHISWDLMRAAWSSVAVLAMAPLQDVLSLGSEARMNLPGQSSGWWRWRYQADQLTRGHLERLRELTERYERAAAVQQV